MGEEWPDRRIDDLARTVEALAPTALASAVLASQVDDLERDVSTLKEDLGARLDGHAAALGKRLDAIETQTRATNGRLQSAEKVIARIQGAASVLVSGAFLAACGYAVKLLFA